MRAQASSMYNILCIRLIQVGYLGIDIIHTSLPQLYTFTFPFNIYNVQTYNTKYYIVLLPYIFVDDIYIASCHNPICCWVFPIYHCFNIIIQLINSLKTLHTPAIPQWDSNPQPQYMSCSWIAPDSRHLNQLSHHDVYVLAPRSCTAYTSNSSKPSSPLHSVLLPINCKPSQTAYNSSSISP